MAATSGVRRRSAILVVGGTRLENVSSFFTDARPRLGLAAWRWHILQYEHGIFKWPRFARESVGSGASYPSWSEKQPTHL